jgi:hypothetical protein
MVIAGYPCQEQYIKMVSYLAYGLLLVSIILCIIFNTTWNTTKPAYIILYVLIFLIIAAMLYFTIDGYNKYNTCAQSKALYEFFFIEIIIAIVLFIVAMAVRAIWAEIYLWWPANLAWPILFLKWAFPSSLRIPALVIGIIFAVISVLSLIIALVYYNYDYKERKPAAITGQWAFSNVLMIGCEILAIVMLVTNGSDGDYDWVYGRSIFVIFAAVNIVDIVFWVIGFWKVSTIYNTTI